MKRDRGVVVGDGLDALNQDDQDDGRWLLVMGKNEDDGYGGGGKMGVSVGGVRMGVRDGGGRVGVRDGGGRVGVSGDGLRCLIAYKVLVEFH